MASQTKAKILASHAANAALNLPLPPPGMRSARDLAADEPFHPLDERIIAGAGEALDDGQTHYVDVPGIPPLREAVARQLNAATGTSYESGNIIVTAGMQEARFLTIQMIGEKTESIGLPAVAHPGVQKALGARPRQVLRLPVDEASGCLPTLDGIAAALADGCRLLYLESPSRLSGAVYSADEVSRIAALVKQHDAAVICDQGLAAWLDGEYSSLAAQASDTTAVIGEIAPGAGLGGWLIGAIAAPSDWLPPMQSQKQIMAICTSTASQYAALAACEIHSETHPGRRAQLRHLREAALSQAAAAGLSALPGAAANLLALRADESARAKLSATGINFAAGEDFGAPGIIRLSIGAAAAAAIEALI